MEKLGEENRMLGIKEKSVMILGKMDQDNRVALNGIKQQQAYSV